MKERVKNIIKNWILRIDEEETLPKEIGHIFRKAGLAPAILSWSSILS